MKYIWPIFWRLLLFIQRLSAIFVRGFSLFSHKLSHKISSRLEFERKNPNISAQLIEVDHLFHVSSEGEFSQIFYLLKKLIGEGERILLLYTSNSLENRIVKLNQEKIPNLITRRVSFFLPGILNKINYKQLKSVNLCRYDFLPELMLIGSRCRKFNIINATSINWRHRGPMFRILIRSFYSQFNLITTSNIADTNEFRQLKLNASLLEIDLRIFEIIQRQKNFSQSVDFFKFSPFLEKIKKCSYQIIFGSAWPEEMSLFKVTEFVDFISNNQIPCLIFPHSFDEKNLAEMTNFIVKSGCTFSYIKTIDDFTNFNVDQIGIVLVKGLLCEMYPYFSHAIIGGGFGVSVHSVLEPMMAETITFCGPNVRRSTEVENFQLNYPQNIFVANTIPKLAQELLKSLVKDKEKFLHNFELSEIFDLLVAHYEY